MITLHAAGHTLTVSLGVQLERNIELPRESLLLSL